VNTPESNAWKSSRSDSSCASEMLIRRSISTPFIRLLAHRHQPPKHLPAPPPLPTPTPTPILLLSTMPQAPPSIRVYERMHRAGHPAEVIAQRISSDLQCSPSAPEIARFVSHLGQATPIPDHVVSGLKQLAASNVRVSTGVYERMHRAGHPAEVIAQRISSDLQCSPSAPEIARFVSHLEQRQATGGAPSSEVAELLVRLQHLAVSRNQRLAAVARPRIAAAAFDVSAYERMHRAGHPAEVIAQRISSDLQCSPNEPSIARLVSHLEQGSSSVPRDVLSSLAFLASAKTRAAPQATRQQRLSTLEEAAQGDRLATLLTTANTSSSSVAAFDVSAYERMHRAGHPAEVIAQRISSDLQCSPNEPSIARFVSHLEQGSSNIPSDVLSSLAFLASAKTRRVTTTATSSSSSTAAFDVSAYERMHRAGHPAEVIAQRISSDLQCSPSAPEIARLVSHLEQGSSNIPSDVLSSLAFLASAKTRRATTTATSSSSSTAAFDVSAYERMHRAGHPAEVIAQRISSDLQCSPSAPEVARFVSHLEHRREHEEPEILAGLLRVARERRGLA